MTQKIWLAFYDSYTGASEEWTTNYTSFVIATTAEKAYKLADDAIREEILKTFDEEDEGFELARAEWDIDLRETVLYS